MGIRKVILCEAVTREEPFDVWLNDTAGPTRQTQWPFDTEHIGDGGGLREVGNFSWTCDITGGRKKRLLNQGSNQDRRAKRRLPVSRDFNCGFDWHSSAAIGPSGKHQR